MSPSGRERSVTLHFDRGTLVCVGISQPAALPLRCPLVFDPRIRGYRGRAVDRQAVVGVLREAGYCVVEQERDLPSLRPAAGGFGTVPLRDYQAAALAAWTAGGRRGLLVLPTGAGKSRIALAALADRAGPRDGSDGEDPECGGRRGEGGGGCGGTGIDGGGGALRSSLVVVPTRVLLRQWQAQLRQFYSGPVGLLGDGVHDLRGVTVATFASARRWMPEIGDRFGLLVVDEAHHFGGSGWGETLAMCAAPARMGLTATLPGGPGLLRLAHLIGPVRFEIGTAELAGSHLAELRIIRLHLDLGPAEREEYEAAKAAFLDVFRAFTSTTSGAPWSEFVRYCRRSVEGRRGLRGWHRARQLAAWTEAKAAVVDQLLARHRSDRVLVFTADKASAYAIAERQLVMPVTSDLSRGERQWALDAFARGELSTLVSARVLNEGVDVPAANVGILVGGAHGDREYLQRLGRLLRPQPGKVATVYELTSAGTTEAGLSRRRMDAVGPA